MDRALEAGCCGFLSKPFRQHELLSRIDAALCVGSSLPTPGPTTARALRAADSTARDPLAAIVGTSQAIADVKERIRTVAPLSIGVLIAGETGTGKELVARAIHALSPRASRPFVAINIAGYPATLFEAHCFGHEAGAFTDARERRAGWFEQAHMGTLFLDEVGELPLDLQPKLLRILEERRLTRLGGRDSIPADVRLIVATNVDLEKAVRSHRFREDLYHRLTVFPLWLPPVRERDGDVALLLDHFIQRAATEVEMAPPRLSQQARAHLAEYRWPGNVRQIENLCRQIVIGARGGVIELDDLPANIRQPPHVDCDSTPDFKRGFQMAVMKFERDAIAAALRAHAGNRSEAARQLNIPRRALYKRIRRLARAGFTVDT
jgi:DNA-binding NtrC family response regulator